MTPKKLQSEFTELCRRLTYLGDPLGTEEGQEKKAVTYTLLYRTVKIQLVYRPRETVLTPPSTLYCRVYPDKNCPLYLHLPQLLPLLDVEDYRACYFPYIETAQRMEDCLKALEDILSPLVPVLEKMGANGDDRGLLERWIRSCVKEGEPEKLLRRDSDEQRMFLTMLRMEEDFHIGRYTRSTAWCCYLDGQRSRALALYGKQKELTDYERGLCRFLETPEGEAFVPISEECFAWRELRAVSSGKSDFGTLVKCALVMYLVCAAAGCLMMGVVQIISAWGTVCWFGPPWWTGLIIGGIPPIFGGIALRRKLIPLVSGKMARKKLEFEDIANASPFATRLAAVVLAVAVVAALFGGVMMAGDTIRFYDERGQYSVGTFQMEEFSQQDVVAVYHIDARHNVYGDRIQRASYVIALKDGTLVDLDGYATVKQTQRQLLPLLREWGVPLIDADSDKDLQKNM